MGKGELNPEVLQGLGASWRMIAQRREPHDLRLPTPYPVFRAILAATIAHGQTAAAICFMLSSFCSLRLEDVRHVRWCDIKLFTQKRTPALKRLPLGLICIHGSKPRGYGPRIQYVTIEEPAIATFLAFLLCYVPNFMFGCPIWLLGPQQLNHVWDFILGFLGLEASGLLVSGLRGGGATLDFLLHENPLRLPWRGRWSHIKTLEQYVQEGMVHPFECPLSGIATATVEIWGDLLDALIWPQVGMSRPPIPLAAPERVAGGGRATADRS